MAWALLQAGFARLATRARGRLPELDRLARVLGLFLPALFPSWRFFQEIKPSPRIERQIHHVDGRQGPWRAFWPAPPRIGAATMARRLFFAPERNEELYLLTCAEKLLQEQSAHAEEEIWRRLQADLAEGCGDACEAASLRFRVAVLHREGARLQKQVVFQSALRPVRRRHGL